MNKKIEWFKVTCPECKSELEVKTQYGKFTCPECKTEFEVLTDKQLILKEIEEIEQTEETKEEILDKILGFMAHSEPKRCVFILTKTDKGITVEGSNKWLSLIEQATDLLSEGVISHIVFEKLPNGKIDARLMVLEKD